ncbi:MAG: response regulator transcription factor, partial [Candidatus Omnitrophica bacterium]|nr:response regulator transcription factor [Candidatus Omnitrophota bacterium]
MDGNEMTIKIVVTDDHSIIREGIKNVLASHSEYEIVAEASNGNEALECVRKLKPDILLLDISMPGLGGLDIIERVKNISPQTKIMMISMHKLGAYVLKAMRQGASAYLNKDDVAEELIPALARVRAGKVYLGEALSEYLSETIKGPAKKQGPADLLTERESDILRLVVEGKTAREIAEVMFLSRRTVENYKNAILKKLNLHKTSDLIKYA